MDPLAQLASLFERFPGIGPRQAFRFVQFILRHPGARRELAEALQQLGSAVHQCPECRRFHASAQPLCGLCANPNRDDTLLAVVASDADVLALERSGTYSGRYFVLGGTVSLASEKASHLRIPELLALAQKKNPTEIILAFPANPEGDATAIRVREDLEEVGMRVTMLGRGLSTGSELEYADAETLKTALANRR
ncbi:MAG: recombination protein RecR [Candidatus Parcubacteria bacterium]|jgi:recombination protein RecR